MKNLINLFKAGTVVAFIGIMIYAFIVISCAPKKDNKPVDAPKEKSQTKIVHDTIYKCPPVSKPLPAITKYRVGDLACAWNKFSGVVSKISWSNNDPNVLVYQLTYLVENQDGTHGWNNDEWYYEAELNPGKCN